MKMCWFKAPRSQPLASSWDISVPEHPVRLVEAILADSLLGLTSSTPP